MIYLANMTQAHSSAPDVQSFLAAHPRWQADDRSLTAVFSLPDFATAMRVVNEVARAAEELHHHPVWTNEYNKLTFVLTTKDQGAVVTQRDIELAEAIEKIVATVTA